MRTLRPRSHSWWAEMRPPAVLPGIEGERGCRLVPRSCTAHPSPLLSVHRYSPFWKRHLTEQATLINRPDLPPARGGWGQMGCTEDFSDSTFKAPLAACVPEAGRGETPQGEPGCRALSKSHFTLQGPPAAPCSQVKPG